MVTHDPRFVDMADRLVHMFDGRIVEAESKDGSLLKAL
jgi:ABC-type siderophore export system fused ATPase/permease subunit